MLEIRSAAAFCFLITTAFAQADPDLFEKKIRPIFSTHCTDCHDASNRKAGLRLDSVAGIRAAVIAAPS